MRQVDESHSGTPVTLAPGEVVQIRLAENPTTGFRWRVQSDGGPACQPAGDRFETSGGPPGGGGMRYLEFVAVQPGEIQIELAYRRGGQQQQPVREFVLPVRVQ